MALDKSAVEAGLMSLRQSMNSFAQEKFDALKGALGFGAIAAGITDTIRQMRQLKRDAEDLGVDTSFLQTFQHLTEKFGGSAEDAGASLLKLNVLIGEARSGSAAAAQKFAALGISLVDASGNYKTAQALFNEIADAYRRTGDSADKAAIAMDFFGRKGAAINNVLAEGSESLRRIQADYEKLGLVVTAANVTAISELQQGFGLIAGFLRNTLGFVVRYYGAIFGAMAGAMVAFKQAAQDIASGRGVDWGKTWETIVAGATAGENRFTAAVGETGQQAQMTADQLKRAADERKKLNEELDRALKENISDEEKLADLYAKQEQLQLDMVNHQMDEADVLRKQIDLQKNKNAVADLEVKISARRANENEREQQAVNRLLDARMTLQRRQQDLKEAKEERSLLTLEQLTALDSRRFTGAYRAAIEKGYEVNRLIKEGKAFAGFDIERSKRAFNRADEIRSGIKFLQMSERYPFRNMEQGIAEAASGVKEIQDTLVQQGVIVIPKNAP